MCSNDDNIFIGLQPCVGILAGAQSLPPGVMAMFLLSCGGHCNITALYKFQGYDELVCN